MTKNSLNTIITSSLTCLLLIFIRWRVGDDFLLGDRLFHGGGILQIAIATLLSAYIYNQLIDRARRPLMRRRLWLIFSIVFFTQLALGITVDTLFLITGELHYPIPSVILTGALYRGEISFMPILFLATLLIAGGAWCSHLCYFGVMDSLAASSKRGSKLPFNRERMRVLFLLFFIATSLLLRWFPPLYATVAGAVSGVIGLGVILFLSRRYKTMIHCTCFCPIGTIVSYMKYISPFRLRKNNHCTQCQACTKACRYGALDNKESIGRSCTYCGDCLSRCNHNGLEYRFFKCSAQRSETIFIITVTVLYSIFICVARV